MTKAKQIKEVFGKLEQAFDDYSIDFTAINTIKGSKKITKILSKALDIAEQRGYKKALRKMLDGNRDERTMMGKPKTND